MRKIVSYALLTISVLTLLVWAISQFVQPILPPELNSAGILLFAALLATVGFIAGFKDTVELFQIFTRAKGIAEENQPSGPVIHAGTKISKAESVVIQTVLGQSTRATLEASRADSPPIIAHNLPQPDYGEFVGRETELAQVIGILRPYPHSQHPIVTIDGVGGIGKSTLALEVAHRFLRSHAQLPSSEQFGAIVWVSAKRTVLTAEGIFPRKQALRTLWDIFSTIASVLQPNSEFESYSNQKQAQHVVSLLVNQRTLLIIDNLETVDDESVLSFIRELPAPTKAIVTTRHRIDVAYPVRLMGMPWTDAQELIRQECKKKGVSLSETPARKLFERTGGVPLAIVLSIGQLGFGHSIESVLKHLGDAEGDITRFCFEESVRPIRGSHAHKLLMALSALDIAASRDALGQIAGLSMLDRDEGLAQLEKLSLINKEGGLFSMLPLTKTYAFHELQTHPEFEHESRFELLYRYADLSFERISPAIEYWWRASAIKGLIAPIGLIGLDRSQEFRLNDNLDAHALIGGITGSGKTNLLHVIITNLALNYSPAELNLYLLDFKQGVEFKIYAGNERRGPLPHSRVIAIGSDRDYGLAVLRSLEQELERRGQLFRDANVHSYPEYRVRNNVLLPRLLLIADQFDRLFHEVDRLAEECERVLGRIISQGRAFGIHVLLSSDSLAGPYNIGKSFRSQIQVRIALQMNDLGSRQVLSEDNSAARFLTRPGQAIYNSLGGVPEGNKIFQVALLPADKHEALLSKLLHFADGRQGEDRFQTIVLEGGAPALASRNPDLIALLNASSWFESLDRFYAWLGEPFALRESIRTVISRQDGDNIVVITPDQLLATGILASITLSIAAQCSSDMAEFFFIRGDSFDLAQWPFDKGELPHPITVVDEAAALRVLGELSAKVDHRKSQVRVSSTDEGSLLVFVLGLHLLTGFRPKDKYQPTEFVERLIYLLSEGPSAGVHLIVWCDGYPSLERFIGRQAIDLFDTRVVTSMNAVDSYALIDSSAAASLEPGRGLLYSDNLTSVAKFKPYQPMSEEVEWLAWAKSKLFEKHENQQK